MKVTLLIVLLGIVVAVSARTKWFQLENYTFENYVREFGKKYSDINEYNFRKELFEKKLESIKRHNKDASKTWKEGVNRFTDRTDDEFKKVLGLKKGLLYSRKSTFNVHQVKERDVADLPTNVDWREQGIISPVKDQGECGSCWSFGTAETVESYYAKSSGLLAVLSEQQILDCTPNPDDCGGTGGCGGGTPELAYAKIVQMGGLSSEWTYSYNSYFGDGYPCDSSKVDPVATITGFNTLPSNQYNPVLNYIATSGPLAVNVDASSWSSYESGVFSGCNMQDPDIDHVVQLVGYGTDTTLGDYWLIRNSWSPSWGEQGYIRIQRSSNPPCGVDTQPSDGTGCNNGPANVTVCGMCAVLYDTSYPLFN